jgi:hypothetical protein
MQRWPESAKENWAENGAKRDGNCIPWSLPFPQPHPGLLIWEATAIPGHLNTAISSSRQEGQEMPPH